MIHFEESTHTYTIDGRKIPQCHHCLPFLEL